MKVGGVKQELLGIPGIQALHEKELGEALPRELTYLLAVRLHLRGIRMRSTVIGYRSWDTNFAPGS